MKCGACHGSGVENSDYPFYQDYKCPRCQGSGLSEESNHINKVEKSVDEAWEKNR